MKRTHRINQAGMVAIIVSMIMMFVITLIVIGFSEVTRRSQRETLDSQLATQAYYAAETGVNDVVNLIAKQGVNPQAMTGGSGCGIGTYSGVAYPRQLNGTGVENTCLLVDANPTSLRADGVANISDTVVWDVKNHNAGVPFSNLTFSWSPDPSVAVGSCNSAPTAYPPASAWIDPAAAARCSYALVRVDIVPAATALDPDSLQAATKTLYLKPSNASAAVTLGGTSAYQGGCVPTGTAKTDTCSVQINVTGADEYYVRVTSLYATTKNLTLTGHDASGVTKFENGQVVIDSTGKAQDQVKRIRVRVPLGGNAELPVFAVQGKGSICKDLTAAAPTVPNPAGIYDAGDCSSIWP
jgi:Tfp pilus assembly protein PilX